MSCNTIKKIQEFRYERGNSAGGQSHLSQICSKKICGGKKSETVQMVQHLKKSYPFSIWNKVNETLSSSFPDVRESGQLGLIIRACEAIFQIAHLYGLRYPSDHFGDYEQGFSKSMCEMGRRACEVQRRVGIQGWVKYFKYKTNAYFADFHHQRLPLPPEGVEQDRPDKLFSGVAHEWLRGFLKYSDENVRLSFVETVLMAKRGMPTVADQMIDDNVDETYSKLTTKRPLSFWNYDQSISIMKPTVIKAVAHKCHFGYVSLIPMGRRVSFIEAQIRRTVRECFKGETITNWSKFRFPSTSANVNNGRKKGGQVFDYRDLLVTGDPVDLVSLSNTMRVQFSYPFSKHGGEVGVEEDASTDREIRQGCHIETSGELHVLDARALRARFDSDYLKLKEAALWERALCELLGLAEPFKVRTISKGPPLKYCTMKPVQKFMWGILSRIEAFALIGRPVTQQDIDVVARFQTVVSGDYKSSTDNMYTWTTEAAWDEICNVCEFDSTIRTIGYSCLTRHEILGRDGVARPQQEGQLMGSIISFPILCIVNAAICRAALERSHERKWSLRDARIPLRVNGDDCLFSSDDPFIEIFHEDLAADVGWELSVGKSYVSDTLAVINSEAFYRNRVENSMSQYTAWRKTGYINLGLLKGQDKSGSENKSVFQLGMVHRCLIYQTPESHLKVVHESFIQYHKDKLEGANLPWFMPQWLGGLGMLPVNGERVDADRSVAALIRSSYNKKYKPHVGTEAEWQMDKLVHNKIKDITPINFHAFRIGTESCMIDEENHIVESLRDSYDQAYGALVVNTLYSSTEEQIKKVVNVGKADTRRLRRNQKMWQAARKDLTKLGRGISPLSDMDLDSRLIKPIFPLIIEDGTDIEDPSLDIMDSSWDTY